MERNPSDRMRDVVSLEVRSIMNHLARILNTRQGSVPILDDYGIPDFTNVPGETLTETALEMEKVIKQVLLKYEPRISDVKVAFEPQKNEIMSLRFKIEGFLLKEKKIPISLVTVVSSEGKVAVSD